MARHSSVAGAAVPALAGSSPVGLEERLANALRRDERSTRSMTDGQTAETGDSPRTHD